MIIELIINLAIFLAISYFLLIYTKDKDVALAFTFYIITKYIFTIYIYFLSFAYLDLKTEMVSVVSLIPILITSLLAYLFLWRKDKKRQFKFYIFYLVIFLLFGSEIWVGIGIPFSITVYFSFLKNQKVKLTKK